MDTLVKSLVWSGDIQPPVRVDDWPNPARALKTVMMYTDNFVGVITIQASLYGSPTEDDWFDIHSEVFHPAGPREEKTRNRFFNSQDRYVWMRVSINKVFGRVDRITVI